MMVLLLKMLILLISGHKILKNELFMDTEG